VLAPQSHLGYLDGLRAAAALYVVVFHALIQIEPDGKTLTGVAKACAALFTFGHHAVDLFIVISGFCLMLPALKNGGHPAGGTRTFLWKRARRILPPYFIALACTLLLIALWVGHKTGTGWDASLPVTQKGLVTHVLLLQDAFVDTAEQINGAFWSISVEWRIYFAFPVLLFAWRKVGPVGATALAILAAYALRYPILWAGLDCNADALVGIMPQYLGLFALGMLGAGISFSHDARLTQMRNRVPWMALMYVTLALVFVLYKVKLFHGSRVPVAYSDLVTGIWAMSLLIAVSVSDKSRLRQLLGWKPVAFVGTFAYSIYLIHGPIQQIIWQYGLSRLPFQPVVIFILQATLGTAIIIGVSYGFFLFAERPFLKRGR